VFDAPQEVMFEAYSDAEHLKQWWGPRGWEIPYCKVDFKPGGVWHYCMKCVDKNQGNFFGMESWGKAIYKNIISPKRIDYTDWFSDKDANVNPDMPSTEISVELIPMGEKTKLVSRATYATPAGLKMVMDMGMMEGISQTWDRLDEHLAKIQK
jgi:uncharacterized protein YndB with AHSA1/START domain